MKFACHQCNARYSIDDERVRGRSLDIRCRQCGATITLRDPRLSGPMGAVTTAETSAPAGPEEAAWHYSVDGESFGPCPENKLIEDFRHGRLPETAYVWQPSFTDGWKPASKVLLFASALREARTPPTGRTIRLSGETLAALQATQAEVNPAAPPSEHASEPASPALQPDRAQESTRSSDEAPTPTAQQTPTTTLPSPAAARTAEVAPATTARALEPAATRSAAAPSTGAALPSPTERLAKLRMTLRASALPSAGAAAAPGEVAAAPAASRVASAQESLPNLQIPQPSGAGADRLSKLRERLTRHNLPAVSSPEGAAAGIDTPPAAGRDTPTPQSAGTTSSEEPAPAPAASLLSAAMPRESAMGADEVMEALLEADELDIEVVDAAPVGPAEQAKETILSDPAGEDIWASGDIATRVADSSSYLPVPDPGAESDDASGGVESAPTEKYTAAVPERPVVGGRPEQQTPSVVQRVALPSDAGTPKEPAAKPAAPWAEPSAPHAAADDPGLLEQAERAVGVHATPAASPPPARRGAPLWAWAAALLLTLVGVTGIVAVNWPDSSSALPPEEAELVVLPMVEIDPSALPEEGETDQEGLAAARPNRQREAGLVGAGRVLQRATQQGNEAATRAAALSAQEREREAEREATRRAAAQAAQRAAASQRPAAQQASASDGLQRPNAAMVAGPPPGSRGGGISGPRAGRPSRDALDQSSMRQMQPSLARCQQRHTASEGAPLQQRVRLELEIEGSGRVSQLRTEDRTLATTAFFRCMQLEKDSWRMPTFEGEPIRLQRTFVLQ